MRRVLLVVVSLLAGCNLYFGPDGDHIHHEHPDAGGPIVTDACTVPPGSDANTIDANTNACAWVTVPAPPSSYTFATCEAGQLVRSAPQTTDTAPPDVAKGAVFGSCNGRCRAPVGVYDCQGDPTCAGAAAWLCEPDPACPADGTCHGPSTQVCGAAAGCGIEVQTETCACNGTTETCTSPCADGLCSPIDVLHAIAGHWQGIVTPPSFADPYPVDIIIEPDGHLITEGCGLYTAFYYGGDGYDPNRYFNITAETSSGAVGEVGVFFSSQEILPGMVTGVHVDGDKMSFTFWDSWLECVRPFAFDLHRVP
jgi:hypothetical protein